MRPKSEIIKDARAAMDIGSDSPEIAEHLRELRVELDDLYVQEAAIESAVDGAPVVSNVPMYLVTLAQDITTIPPGGKVEANRITRTLAAVVIIRPEEDVAARGHAAEIAAEELLPRDLGLRVFGNWRIVEVQKCEAYETEISGDNEPPT
jgi:hypothetical protein